MHAKTFSLKKSFRAAWLAASLSVGIAGCGGGSSSAPPAPPPPPSLSQTATLVNGDDVNYTATLTNVNQAIRRMTYNGNQFGNDTTITPNYSETLSCLNIGDYSSRLEATGATTHIVNWNIPAIDPTADFSSLNTDIKDKYEEKALNLEGLVVDPNCEDDSNVEIISATSLDGKVNVSVNGKELMLRGVPGSSGAYEIEVEYGSQEGGISKSVLSGNMIEVPWQVAFRSFLPMSTVPNCGLCDDIYIMDDDGKNLRRLTTNIGEEIEPTWSSDGTRIAYAGISQLVGDSRIHGLFVINSDGTGEGEQLHITQGGVFARYPSWSPDGKKLHLHTFPLKKILPKIETVLLFLIWRAKL